MGAIHHLLPPLMYDATIPFYSRPNIVHSPIKKQEREPMPTKKREVESSTKEEEHTLPLKKRMRGSIPPLPKYPPFSPIQETPRRESSQGIPTPSMSVDDFIDLEALNQMIEEDNAQAARWGLKLKGKLSVKKRKKERQPRLKACGWQRKERREEKLRCAQSIIRKMPPLLPYLMA